MSGWPRFVALGALLLASLHSTARGDGELERPSLHAAQPPRAPVQPAGEPQRPALLRLTPSARELHAQRSAELERRIERTLTALPEVAAARVQLTLPLEAEVPLDGPLPKPSAALLLTTRASEPSDRDYAAIVASALSGREPTLTIVRRPLPQPASARVVQLGPFRVEERSAFALRVTLTVTLVTNALLALLLLGKVRTRSTRRTES